MCSGIPRDQAYCFSDLVCSPKLGCLPSYIMYKRYLVNASPFRGDVYRCWRWHQGLQVILIQYVSEKILLLKFVSQAFVRMTADLSMHHSWCQLSDCRSFNLSESNWADVKFRAATCNKLASFAAYHAASLHSPIFIRNAMQVIPQLFDDVQTFSFALGAARLVLSSFPFRCRPSGVGSQMHISPVQALLHNSAIEPHTCLPKWHCTLTSRWEWNTWRQPCRD